MYRQRGHAQSSRFGDRFSAKDVFDVFVVVVVTVIGIVVGVAEGVAVGIVSVGPPPPCVGQTRRADQEHRRDDAEQCDEGWQQH